MIISLGEAIGEFERTKVWPDDVPPVARYTYFIVDSQLNKLQM